MAIDFAKSATSYWDLAANGIGAIISGKQVVTVHMHVWIDSLTTTLATDNVILRTWYDGTDPQLHIGINATADPVHVLYVSLKPAGETAQVISSGGVISSGQWVSVAVVCDINGDNTIAYVNGSDSTHAKIWTATSFSTNSPTDPDAIGANGGDYTGTDMHFDGRIAELAIWDRELTVGEITALSNHAGAERIGGRPILYLPMLHNAQGTDGVFAKCRYSGLEPTTGGGESLHSTHPPICYPKRHSAAFGIYVAAAASFYSGSRITDKHYEHDGFTATILDSYATRPELRDMTWDGSNILYCDSTDAKCYQQSGFSATVSSSFTSPSTAPSGATWTGGNFYSCDYAADKMYQHSGFTSTISSSFSAPATLPLSVGHDGTDLYSCDYTADKFYQHSGFTSTISSSFTSSITSAQPTGSAMAEGDLYSVDITVDKCLQHSGFTSTISSSFASPGNNPSGISSSNHDGL